MIAAVKAVGRKGHREMTFDRINPRRAFTMMCEARWMFGDEAAKQCFNDMRAASQEAIAVVNAFTAGVADDRIPIYVSIQDDVIGERRFQICPQEELIETFVILMAEEANHDPWPSTPPAPLYTIDRSDIEQFISIWLKENGLDDMRLDGAPTLPFGTAKDACRSPTDIHRASIAEAARREAPHGTFEIRNLRPYERCRLSQTEKLGSSNRRLVVR
jgi:hypothetical protein